VTLADFTINLLTTGEAKVDTRLSGFDEGDQRQTLVVLHKQYERYCQEMPGIAPAFDAAAALWGATYLYSAIQLILMRDLGEAEISGMLADFSGEKTAGAVASADILLHHLPALLKVSASLAPGDVLLQYFNETACAWPYSAVGMETTGIPDLDIILSCPSLKNEYINRIITARDNNACIHPVIKQEVVAALGGISEVLWPGFIKV
jgi:hypothetical protein